MKYTTKDYYFLQKINVGYCIPIRFKRDSFVLNEEFLNAFFTGILNLQWFRGFNTYFDGSICKALFFGGFGEAADPKLPSGNI